MKFPGNWIGKGTPRGSGAIAVILAILIVVVLAALAAAVWWILQSSPRILNKTSDLVNQQLNQAPTPTQTNSKSPANTNTKQQPAPTPSPEPEEVEPDETETNEAEQPASGGVCPEAGSCNADAQVYCPDEWSGTSIEASWKLDLVNCLYDEHKDDISAECRESLECRQQLNENLLAACEEDKRKFCASTRPKPGSEPLVSCLGEHYSELSADCAAAWTAHDAAKPQ